MQDGTYLVTDGAIVNYGERWAYGYFVALHGGIKLDRKSHIAPENWVRYMGSDFEGVSHLIGVWTDHETGTVYIDPVEHIADYETAVAHATQRGELAIWDAREDREIRI